MTKTMSSNTSLLESDPLNQQVWEQVRVRAAASGDFLGIKTLPIVIAGITKLNERLATDYEDDGKPVFSKLSGMQRSTLIKLVSSYNNPRILKEMGMLYLGEFRLPEEAGKHFRRAQALNEADDSLEELIERADAASAAGSKEATDGVEPQQHARKRVASMIRKTGKVALSRQQLEAVSPPPGTAEDDNASSKGSGKINIDIDIESKDFPDCNDDALELAVELVRQGDVSAGLKAAKKIADRTENEDVRFVVWTEVAYACFQKGLTAEALKAYETARDAAPDILMSWFNYGLALHVTGDFEQALESYRKGDSIEPNHPKVWCNIGALYFQLDRFDAAEQALRKTVEIRPSYARAWDNLAAAMGAQNKLNETRSACQRALALRPDFPEAWFKLAMVCYHDGDLGEAEKGFRNALNHEELAPFALNYLALICADQGNLEKAEQYARDGIELDPNNPAAVSAWVEIGIGAFKADQFPRAIEALSQATKVGSESFDAWFNLGRSYEKAGDLAEARDAYAKSGEIRPESYAAYHRLGRTAMTMQDLPLAIKAYKQLAEIAPEDEVPWRRLAASLDAKGMCQLANEALLTAESLASTPDRGAANITTALGRIRELL